MNSKSMKSVMQVALVLIVLVWSYLYGIGAGMHHVVPGGIQRNAMFISVAVSNLKYGLSGYMGYNRIFFALVNGGMTTDKEKLLKYGFTRYEDALTNKDFMQGVLDSVLKMEYPNLSGQYNMLSHDFGMVDYYRVAFKIFGFKIESFYYLYFLIFTVLIIAYIVCFYGRPGPMNLLLVVLCAHLAAMKVLPQVGIELMTVHNVRCIPLLLFIPTLHIALLVRGGRRAEPLTAATAVAQACVIIFVCHIRSTGVISIMAIMSLFAIWVIRQFIINPSAGMYVFRMVRVWPIVLVLCGMFILKFFLAAALHHSYDDDVTGHSMWDPMYAGLQYHPDISKSVSKTGCHYTMTCGDASVRKKREQEAAFSQYKVHEFILKGEVFKIIKEDPGYAVVNYLNKMVIIFKRLFSASYGLIGGMSNPWMLVIIAAGAIVTIPATSRRFLRDVQLMTVIFLLWLGIGILFLPDDVSSSETAFALAAIIYLSFSALIGKFAEIFYYKNFNRSPCV